MTPPLSELVGSGVLRVAINTGNRALVQRDGDVLDGISPALAQKLAHTIGARFEPILYDGAGQVFADAGRDIWDVAFLAIDPKRAERVAFTQPYITIEATFAARCGSSIKDVQDVDRDGIRVLTAQGSAYDLHLTKTLKHAMLERFGTPPESFEAFRKGTWDVVAGVRASLELAFDDSPDIRILPGVLTKVEQAMVLPSADHPLREALDDFVSRAIDDGFVAAVLSGRLRR